MLTTYEGFNPYTLARGWGAVHTDIGNRQSTPADVAILFERLNRHEILSESSRQELLSIMRTHSPDRELPALVKGLPDAAALDLFRRGYLQLVYLMRNSLNHLASLVQRKNRTFVTPRPAGAPGPG